MNSINVICLQDEAFYKLMDEVIGRIEDRLGKKTDRWITAESAMEILKIKSTTTLAKLRNEGKLSYFQPEQCKFILYDRNSIDKYIEDNIKHKF